jgi:hypothetical protein
MTVKGYDNQVEKAIDCLEEGKVAKAFKALTFKCKQKPMLFAVRYNSLVECLRELEDGFIKISNHDQAILYCDALNAIREHVKYVLSSKGGKL